MEEKDKQFWAEFADKICSVTESSLASGKLCPLATTCTAMPSAITTAADTPSAPFVIRTLEPRVKSAKKPEGDIQVLPESTLEDAKRRSPFLHPDPALVVAALPQHNVILNKYPVTKHHILLCTTEFRTQEEHLTPADLLALEKCARYAYPRSGALCFYNCGLLSGASQGHKHVQIVPAVVAESDLPPQRYFLDSLAAPLGREARTIPGLGFRHAFRRVGDGDSWVRVYGELLEQLGMSAEEKRAKVSYNFVCTREWMFVVPRARESAGVVRDDGSEVVMSVNSLGFAGSFLVKNPLDVDAIRKMTPLKILDEITFLVGN